MRRNGRMARFNLALFINLIAVMAASLNQIKTNSILICLNLFNCRHGFHSAQLNTGNFNFISCLNKLHSFPLLANSFNPSLFIPDFIH